MMIIGRCGDSSSRVRIRARISTLLLKIGLVL